MPAHFDHPPAVLGPTLPAADFTGKTRAAYKVAEQIPETLAQLPCYCYCDRGMGHKSLHSCFEDEHAAHCVVCVDEALLAYSLTKDAKMTPQQVREKIVEKYSADQWFSPLSASGEGIGGEVAVAPTPTPNPSPSTGRGR
jgi:hypothetical protein